MQQFDEDELNEDEMSETEPEMEEVELEESPEDEEEVEEVEEEEEEEEPRPMSKSQRKHKANMTGLWLTIFTAVVVILIGGLASFYYFTFQSQGSESEKEVKATWKNVAEATTDMVNSFKRVDSYDGLLNHESESFAAYVDIANREVRDAGFSLRNQTGLSVKASSVSSKMSAFLEEYQSYTGTMRSTLSELDGIESASDLDDLVQAGKDSESAYDDLLEVNNGFLKASLPRTVFDIGNDIQNIMREKLGQDSADEAENKSDQNLAQTSVSQFVQAWKDRDAEAMMSRLTAGAKAEFPVGILEDSVDVTGLSITDTQLSGDGASITIMGTLKKRTPDGVEQTESWKFVLLPNGEQWLIDSWTNV